MKKQLMIYFAAALVAAAIVQWIPGNTASTGQGTLHGVVTDPSGAAIPRASVTVSNGLFARTVPTDPTGQFAVAGLAPGHYRVDVRYGGFSPFEKSGFLVSPGRATEADAQLIIHAPTQRVTVTANVHN